jgi:hypothetical protein
LITAPFVLLYEWLVGVEDTSNISQAALDATRGMQINPAKLGLRPEPIALNELELAGEIIDFNEMLVCFDKYYTTNNTGFTPPEIASTRGYIEGYITYIQETNLPSEMYRNNIQGFARNIIFEMLKPDDKVPVHKKITAFMEIANACEKCRPRRYEESKRQYLLLANRMTTMDQKLLVWIQMLKDDIIIQAFQRGQFHVINRARNMPTLANKWGLDNVDQVNTNDEHIGCGGSYSESEADAVLTNGYFPARLVDSIKARFDFEGDNELLNEYLQHEDGLPSDFATQFYERSSTQLDQMAINAKGVAWILKKQGFLI